MSTAFPLVLPSILRRSARRYPESRIISPSGDGERIQLTFEESYQRILRLMNVLRGLGVRSGDRIGTFAWNHHQNHELYFAAPCIGATLHTINLRLRPDELTYVLRHAETSWIFVDREAWPHLRPVLADAPSVKGIVLMGSGEDPDVAPLERLDYETLLGRSDPIESFPKIDEREAGGLCYTSGTTGRPKGVVFSHRTLCLHAMALGTQDSFCLWPGQRVLPLVPLFHANGWGLPHGCALHGADLVYPGSRLTGDALCGLMRREQVTLAAGVPSIWSVVLQGESRAPGSLDSVQTAVVGGAAPSRELLKTLVALDIAPRHSWGMTEMAPVGTVNWEPNWRSESTLDPMMAQGFPIAGVEARVMENGVPKTQSAEGALEVRGPCVATGYYRETPDPEVFREDGWFRTGDIARIDTRGRLWIVDREKDIIKVGGEWVSSLAIENAAYAAGTIAEAGAIAIPDSLRGERPALFVVAKPETETNSHALRDHILQSLPRWQCPKPQDIHWVDELPKTGVGKIDKRALRAEVME